MKELIKFSNGNGIILISTKGINKYYVCKDLKLQDGFTYKVVDYSSFDDYDSAFRRFKSLEDNKFFDVINRIKDQNSKGYFLPGVLRDLELQELFISSTSSLLDLILEKSR